VSVLLDVQGLTVGLPNGRAVLRDLSFAVAPGEVVALVGESGSGKTMAARAVLGLLPPPLARSAGRVLLDGQDLTVLTPDALRRIRGRQVGMVFQEPMTSLNPALRIGRQMTEAQVLHLGLTRAEAEARAVAMLRRIGLSDPEGAMGSHPHRFSGGMRQRILIGSVMLLGPRLLLADEPTTALDAITQREVLDLMAELAREAGAGVLLISHDLPLVAGFASRSVVLLGGEKVEEGLTRDLLRRPSHPYTARLVAALPQRTPSRRAEAAAPLLRADDVSITFPGRRGLLRRAPPTRAVQEVTLEIMPGETLALAGASGSGKTTLGRALLGLVRPNAGRITFAGRDLAGFDRAAWRGFRLACQLVFQDPFSSLDPRQRVAAILEEPLRLLPEVDARERTRRAEAMLEEVGLAGFGPRLPHELSGGQRQRVAIARALIRRPRLVVADEPVSALDLTVQKQILGLFRELKERHGFAALFITHDIGVVEEVADRVAVMEAGRIVELGRKEEVLDNPRHPYTRRLLAAVPARLTTAEAAA
jgi:peptide/nickel transport system ATP-binding protein